MRVVIIDDEPLAVQLLKQYTDRHPDLSLTGAYTDPVDGLAAIQQTSPDLVLLDIQMAELNGLHVARLLKGRCAVVFTTAYEAHALAGYDLGVVDYLLKPVSFARFEQAIEKVRAHRRMLMPPPSPDQSLPTDVFIKSGTHTVRVAVSSIQYATSADDYLVLYLADGPRVLTSENLRTLLARLPPRQFCRIHRSHFVRLDQLDFVERGRRVVIGKVWLPIGEQYRAAFLERLGVG